MNIPNDVRLPDRLWTELLQWRSGYSCERCGLSRDELKAAGRSGYLTGHHKDHDHSNSRLDNGECLCPSCHTKHHGGGTKPCKPGCTCGRHKAHNKKSINERCPYGHLDWYIHKNGKKACRECRKQSLRRYYQESPEYRQRQIAGTTSRRRAKRIAFLEAQVEKVDGGE